VLYAKTFILPNMADPGRNKQAYVEEVDDEDTATLFGSLSIDDGATTIVDEERESSAEAMQQNDEAPCDIPIARLEITTVRQLAWKKASRPGYMFAENAAGKPGIATLRWRAPTTEFPAIAMFAENAAGELEAFILPSLDSPQILHIVFNRQSQEMEVAQHEMQRDNDGRAYYHTWQPKGYDKPFMWRHSPVGFVSGTPASVTWTTYPDQDGEIVQKTFTDDLPEGNRASAQDFESFDTEFLFPQTLPEHANKFIMQLIPHKQGTSAIHARTSYAASSPGNILRIIPVRAALLQEKPGHWSGAISTSSPNPITLSLRASQAVVFFAAAIEYHEYLNGRSFSWIPGTQINIFPNPEQHIETVESKRFSPSPFDALDPNLAAEILQERGMPISAVRSGPDNNGVMRMTTEMDVPVFANSANLHILMLAALGAQGIDINDSELDEPTLQALLAQMLQHGTLE